MNLGHPCPAVYDRQAGILLAVLHRRWPQMGPHVRILDLGCGDGEMVRLLRRRGWSAWGADPAGPESGDTDLFLPMDPSTGQVATRAGSFDVVISNQVLEHVMDLPRAFQEIRRLLRPGGVSLHVFPSRWCLVEQHVNVPLGGVFRSPSYLWCWAALGIRNPFQTGLGPGRVADLNFRYLRDHTNYPTERGLKRAINPHFQALAFVERDFLACYADTGDLPRWKAWAVRGVLALHLEGLYRLFRARALWLQG